MQTIKTSVVVVMLLAVLYGAYVALNGSDTPLPREVEELAGMNLELDFNPNSTSSSKFNGFPESGPSINGHVSDNSFKPASPPTFGGFETPQPLTPGKSLVPNQNNSDKNQENSVANSPQGFSYTPPGGSLAPVGSPPSLSSDLKPSTNAAHQATSIPKSNGLASTDDLLNATMPLPTKSPQVANDSNIKPPNQAAMEIPSMAEALAFPNSDFPKALSSETLTSSPSQNSMTGRSFANAKRLADEQVMNKDFKEALATLSLFCSAPELTSEQHQELLDRLDPLAAEVIYSRQHYLDLPYFVRNGEKLESVAKQFSIPEELLAKINGIENPAQMTAGTKLKVLPGPFRAEVNISRNEIWVFLGDLYAGRYPVTFGTDPQPIDGEFKVLDKIRNRNYYGQSRIDGNDPRNPYGGWWMDLGQNICIHGSPIQVSPDTNRLGCISLSPQDASDVYAALSQGSNVRIRR